MTDVWKTDYPSQTPHQVTGELLNKTGRQLQHVANEPLTPGETIAHRGMLRGQTSPPPFVQGIALISDARDVCEDDDNVKGGKKPPCSSQHLYMAKFRWYSHTDGSWREQDRELWLDASSFYEITDTEASRSPTTGQKFGHIPVYRKGDSVPAYWDPQRITLIPMQGAFQDIPSTEYCSSAADQLVEAHEVSEDTNVVEIYLEIQPGGSGPWYCVEKLSFRVPENNEGNWFDTRSNFVRFIAPHGTKVRMRGLKTVSYGISVTTKRLAFYGSGRQVA